MSRKGPTLSLALDWRGGQEFRQHRGSPAVRIDGGDNDIVSPMQTMAYGIMACMAIDVVHILEKGRHRLDGLTVRLEGERAPTYPRRFIAMHLHFALQGRVTERAVARAIELSRHKYCSAWNSVREDVELTTDYAIDEPHDR